MTRGPFERCPWLTLQPHGALPHGLGRCLASPCSCQLYGLVGQHLSPSTWLAARRTRVAVRWDIKWLRSPFLLFSAVVNGMSSWKTAKMVNQRWAYQNPLCSCMVSDFAYDWLLFCTVFIWERVWAGSPRYKCLDGTSCWEDFCAERWPLRQVAEHEKIWALWYVACESLAEEGCAHTFHVLPQVKQGTVSAIMWLLHCLCVGCCASFLVCHLNLAVPCIYFFF